ncbi:nucleolar protein,Nop52-domain-containing protein [Cladochytrium replicatum]|nr:nucleolar protein,Nop52-domain-containing protein [Cladochytrium replicatum]
MPTPSFGQQLAHTDKKVRDRAIVMLSKFLGENPEISDMDLCKLCYGLFYCFWMSDKVAVQNDLAQSIGSLVLHLEPLLALRYMSALWRVMVLQWTGIDHLRLDKYYKLLRTLHYFGFRFLERMGWEDEYLDEYLGILRSGPLEQQESKVPDGLKYHTVEVFLDELEKSTSNNFEQSVGTKLALFMLQVLVESDNHVLQARIIDAVQPRLTAVSAGRRYPCNQNDINVFILKHTDGGLNGGAAKQLKELLSEDVPLVPEDEGLKAFSELLKKESKKQSELRKRKHGEDAGDDVEGADEVKDATPDLPTAKVKKVTFGKDSVKTFSKKEPILQKQQSNGPKLRRDSHPMKGAKKSKKK